MADTASTNLSADQVRAIARLARLAISDDEVQASRSSLNAVVAYMDRLRALDLTKFEPMAHVGDAHTRLDDDTPREPLPTSALMKMTPDHWENFVRVPRVMGDGGGGA